ncbi:hypothetical protein M378DRAFT_9438 [Amanita muscaria Koide BX008]|uniref:Uncharacterized protein n=1 Tax=Amanita muscaria (strain Koide BX008) TaxID=946122 RepID=A0A0C2TKV6_AMAMK|nr:hypothetical protein M378DRAFT_9438 [Amanita muscaria Koide BX008]
MKKPAQCYKIINSLNCEHAVEESGEKLSARTSLGLHLERAWGLATGDVKESEEKLSAQTSPGLHSGRHGDWGLGTG